MQSLNIIVNSLQKRIEGYKNQTIVYDENYPEKDYKSMVRVITNKMICRKLEEILYVITSPINGLVNGGMSIEEYLKSKVNDITSNLYLTEIPIEGNSKYIMSHNADIFVLALLMGYLELSIYNARFLLI